MDDMRYHPTMWPELVYGKVCAGLWRFFNVDDDGSKHAVGEHYPTKDLLLSDMRRYAKENWGLC